MTFPRGPKGRWRSLLEAHAQARLGLIAPQEALPISGRLTIRVDGRALHYRRIGGRPGSPTIVFSHEGLGSLELWRDFPERICTALGYAGIVYSRYGNGFSEELHEARTIDYMHHEGRVVLPELLDAFGIDAPVLYGHSDGASISLIFAATFPLRVRALVLEAPHVMVERVSLESIAKIREVYREGTLRERMRKYHADVDRTFYGWNDVWLSAEFVSWQVTELLSTIVAPSLCIQGTDDEYGTLAQLDTIAQSSRGPFERVVLEGCGHAPHRERSEAVTVAVVSRLREMVR